MKTAEPFIHAFNLVPGIHYGILQKLQRTFFNWEYAWKKADPASLRNADLSEVFVQAFLKLRETIDVDEAFAKLAFKKITAIGIQNENFPFLLKQIPLPPFLIYCKGTPLKNFEKTTSPMIAMVGTRRCSSYGENIANQLATQIAVQDAVVVSGLAFGIDAICHRAAFKLQKPTVAVLASDLHEIAPPSHHFLSGKILATGGTLVSEYAHNYNFYKGRFHERNRLISGLCKATIVIEAPLPSGALITARHALEQNRDVYALPGDITRKQSAGCLRLIMDGATPIVSIDDVLIRLGLQVSAACSANFSAAEQVIIAKLQQGAASTEELLALKNWPIQELQILLTQLELKGSISKNKAFLWELH